MQRIAMSTWRRKAIELFPDFKREIEESHGVGEAWGIIEYDLLFALENLNENYIKSVKQYFTWCINTHVNSEPHQSALCGFIEDIGTKKQYWPYLDLLLTSPQFECYKSVLGYSISQEQLKVMENSFYKR
jgi:hypothetical protein